MLFIENSIFGQRSACWALNKTLFRNLYRFTIHAKIRRRERYAAIIISAHIPEFAADSPIIQTREIHFVEYHYNYYKRGDRTN